MGYCMASIFEKYPGHFDIPTRESSIEIYTLKTVLPVDKEVTIPAGKKINVVNGGAIYVNEGGAIYVNEGGTIYVNEGGRINVEMAENSWLKTEIIFLLTVARPLFIWEVK